MSLLETNPIKTADWTLKAPGLEPLRLSKKNRLAFRKQAIFEGKHPYNDDEFEVDESLIDHWVDTGAKMLSEGIKIPLPNKHTEDSEANRGFITGFEKATDLKGRMSLYVTGKARDEDAVKTLKANDISLFSPVSRKIAGKVWQRPITHAAITSYPVVKGLEGFQLALSYGGELELMEGKQHDDESKKCPHCGKNVDVDPESVDDEGKLRTKRQIYQLSATSEELDKGIREMSKTTGEPIYVVRQKTGTLVLAESELEDEMNPSLVFSG